MTHGLSSEFSQANTMLFHSLNEKKNYDNFDYKNAVT